jgi:hypothetical protein
MITRSRRIERGSLVLLAVVLGASAVRPCDPAKTPRKARVSVLIILASEKDDKIDPKLSCIAREVRRTHPKLKGFRMDKLSWRSLKIGQCEKFDLGEGQKACVTVERAADKMERVRLKVGPPAMGQITYSTPCGKFLPIVTPFRTKKGDVVLIAVRVQPCRTK